MICNKINVRHAFSAAILSLISTQVSAGTLWHPVARVNGSEVFIDEKSKRYDRGTPLDKEGDRRKVHVLFSYDSPQQDSQGNRFYSETFVDEINCAKRTVTTMSTKRYKRPRGTGAVVYAHKVRALLPQPIVPGTVNALIMETFVCDI